MRPDDRVRLQHMLDAARTAMTFAQQASREDLGTDELRAHGLVRLIEIIGEAAARVTPATRSELPALPWPAIVGMRNRLIHGYYDIDLDRVWDTLTHDLPPMAAELERWLAEQM